VAEPQVAEHDPAELLEVVRERVAFATFTGKGETPVVTKMLREFAWMISRGLEQVVE
jgi:hypothetical protein